MQTKSREYKINEMKMSQGCICFHVFIEIYECKDSCTIPIAPVIEHTDVATYKRKLERFKKPRHGIGKLSRTFFFITWHKFSRGELAIQRELLE